MEPFRHMKSVLAFLLLASPSMTFSLSQPEMTVIDPSKMCENVRCRAGRECRVLSSGIAECVCVRKCSSHEHFVCGSDGMIYLNHCELHRTACIEGRHIRPMRRRNECKKDPLIYLKRIIQKSAQEVKQYDLENIQVPATCHQNERNRMREFLISWMSLTAKKHKWYDEYMEYDAILKHHWLESDGNTDGFLDSIEWIEYIHKSRSKPLDVDNKVTHDKLLCLEALIEEGDENQDWRLDKQEFLRLFDLNYKISNKYCLMDKTHYEDGTKTSVDCNGCVCSCGKWVCTSYPCHAIPYVTKDSSEEQSKDESLNKAEANPGSKPQDNIVKEEEVFTYDDMDNVIQ